MTFDYPKVMQNKVKSMVYRIALAVIVLAAQKASVAEQNDPIVRMLRVPNAGIQPQLAVGRDNALHMLYYKGDAGAGDIFYVVSTDSANSFSDPLRVNSQPGSAIAAGTIRGAHLALGKDDRVHVAWNGSGKAQPKGLPNPQLPEDSPYRYSSPMLYARMKADGTGFEPQRNLMTSTHSLDGGGSVAADDAGNVYVVWHANSTTGPEGEEGRSVWIATSTDDGRTFSAETRAVRKQTGACGCCGLRASTDRMGNVFVLYRSAMDTIHRDMYVLASRDKGQSFTVSKLDDWKVGQCVMSSASFHETSDGMLAAWETEQQVKFGPVGQSSSAALRHVSAPETNGKTRKHPVLSTNSTGHRILAWTEGTGWQKGGSVAWQVFDPSGRPIAETAGRADGVPVWGLVAVFAGKDDQFTVVY